MQSELQAFVREALLKGLDRKDIDGAMKNAGWEEAERQEALTAFAEEAFPVPVPRRRPYLSAREAFMYLFLFMTLYLSAFHLGSLLFAIINRAFPDALNASYYGASLMTEIRLSVSTLLVAFPVFVWISSILRRALVRHPENRDSKIRKWLTYLTLFGSSGVIISDVISLVYHLLGGELTTRFVLKTAVVLLIAGLIFGYYLWDLRQDEQENKHK